MIDWRALGMKTYASMVHRRIKRIHADPIRTQEKILSYLLRKASSTAFGKEHSFSIIQNYNDFRKHVPIRNYESLRPYVERVIRAEKNILWPGIPLYLAKTSGTTSGTKYIPITKSSMPNHVNSARDALMLYAHHSKNYSFFNGRTMFLSGSPLLEETAGIKTGRLSGIVNHHIPSMLKTGQLPSWETNCIEDWETKLDAILDETSGEDLRVLGGIPPWVQMYLDKLTEREGKPVIEIFKNLSVFITGGVNYEPYRKQIESSIGKAIDTIEYFPASEGFFAYQDLPQSEGLLLNIDSGIYYEFIPLEEYGKEKPIRLNLSDVELGQNYALIISSNAGLWAYDIGDTVQFISLEPHRLIVSGRVKHFISAFGEHVIGSEVEYAMNVAAKKYNAEVIEFTVAPKIEEVQTESHHEWFIAFSKRPSDINAFTAELDRNLREKNSYYKDLIDGGILKPLKINILQNNAFQSYMESIGKLGGQNKVPRLSNDRKVADALEAYIME